MTNYCLMLGNGFTIDLIKHIESKRGEEIELDIDVVNLFSHGDKVHYPVNPKEPGFLSRKYCPNLWSMGARSDLNGKQTMEIIEDIITCANASIKLSDRYLEVQYKYAYQELAVYLKYLFIYFNEQITDEKLRETTKDWSWLKFLKKLNENDECTKICIVTYNYDIWLERILKLNNIDFEISGLEQKECKIKIFKPHGSISFAFKEPLKDETRFKLTNENKDLINGEIEDYSIVYERLSEDIYSQSALIPPAGDSSRLGVNDSTWAGKIQKLLNTEILSIHQDDEFIISGISYWHVDRLEMDNILINMPEKINVKMINPSPPRTLQAVLTGLFPKSIHYKSSKILEGL